MYHIFYYSYKYFVVYFSVPRWIIFCLFIRKYLFLKL
jgi:hypothetical protein